MNKKIIQIFVGEEREREREREHTLKPTFSHYCEMTFTLKHTMS